MDLLSLTQALWRHKLAAIPVFVLVALASLYVVVIKPPVYQTSSSILLTNPPSAATPAQIAADPGLRKADPFNTFAGYGSLSIIAQAVIDTVTSTSYQSALARLGVDRRYQVTLYVATDEPISPPIIDITSYGASTQQASLGARLLTAAIEADLYRLQSAEGINSFYMIKAIDVVKADQPQLSIAGKVRSLVAILGLGLVLLLLVVSVTDARDRRRAASDRGAGTRRRGARFPDPHPHELDLAAAHVSNGPGPGMAQRR